MEETIQDETLRTSFMNDEANFKEQIVQSGNQIGGDNAGGNIIKNIFHQHLTVNTFQQCPNNFKELVDHFRLHTVSSPTTNTRDRSPQKSLEEDFAQHGFTIHRGFC